MVQGLANALNASDIAVQKSAVIVVETMIGYQRDFLKPEMIKSLFAILRTHPDVEARRAAFDLLRQASGDVAKKAAEKSLLMTPTTTFKIAQTEFIKNLPNRRLVGSVSVKILCPFGKEILRATFLYTACCALRNGSKPHISLAARKNQIACPKIKIANPCRSGVNNPEQIATAVTKPRMTP